MSLSHLMLLRESSPGSPSAREISRRMKVSPQAVIAFERGELAVTDEFVSKYARTIGADVAEVRRLFLLSGIRHHRTKLRELLALLKSAEGKGRKLVAAG